MVQAWQEDREILALYRHMKSGNIHKRGFTLVELLVVISIISVMMGIVLPVFSRVRLQARTMLSMSNQRQITSAMNLYASDHDERYPESVPL